MSKRGMNNVKAESSPTGNLVTILIVIIVLVVVVAGFVMGWNNLFTKLFGFGGGNSNIDTVVGQCNLACDTNQVNAYCETQRELKFADGAIAPAKCSDLINNQEIDAKMNGQTPAVKKRVQGVQDCTSICVPGV